MNIKILKYIRYIVAIVTWGLNTYNNIDQDYFDKKNSIFEKNAKAGRINY